MLPRLVVSLVLPLALAACGSRPVIIGGSADAAPLPAASSGGTSISSAPSATDDTTFPTATPRASALRSGGTGDGEGFTPGPGPNNTMPLQVRLSRTCVQPGEEMQATAITLPASKLAFAAAYSDNDIVPDFTYTPAEANPTGTFTWTWVIRPTIPPGDALVSVVAAKGDRGASYEQLFRVARTC